MTWEYEKWFGPIQRRQALSRLLWQVGRTLQIVNLAPMRCGEGIVCTLIFVLCSQGGLSYTVWRGPARNHAGWR